MTDRTRTVDREMRVLRSLQGGPKTVNEIADHLRREVWDAWSERHGYDFEWDTDEEPVGARLLAVGEADDLGLPYLFRHEVYAVLRRLERKQAVTRIQIEGRRPMLWRLGDTNPLGRV